MNKVLKLLLIILGILAVIIVAYFFVKTMTGNVVLNNDTNNSTDEGYEHFSGNETPNRHIDNYSVVNKNPADLNEGECSILDDGRKVCLIKKGTRVNAGEVNEVDDGITTGQSG